MRWTRGISLGLLGALLLAGAIWGRSEHPHFWWEEVPGFFALLGFAGSCLLVALKGLGKRWLQRAEQYYDDFDH